MLHDFNRVNKNQIRANLMRGLTPRSLLTLPSAQALCVQELISAGGIDQGTRQVWVENNPRVRVEMEATARALGLNPDIVLTDLEDYQPDRSFDLINADLMSGFTVRLGRWFERMQDHVEPGATIILTTIGTSRNGTVGESNDWFDTQIEAHPLLMRVRDAFAASRPDYFSRTPERAIVRNWVLLNTCFHRYRLGPPETYLYQDIHYTMVNLRFQVTEGPSEFPSFSELMDGFAPVPVTFERDGVPLDEHQRELALLRRRVTAMRGAAQQARRAADDAYEAALLALEESREMLIDALRMEAPIQVLDEQIRQLESALS